MGGLSLWPITGGRGDCLVRCCSRLAAHTTTGRARFAVSTCTVRLGLPSATFFLRTLLSIAAGSLPQAVPTAGTPMHHGKQPTAPEMSQMAFKRANHSRRRTQGPAHIQMASFQNSAARVGRVFGWACAPTAPTLLCRSLRFNQASRHARHATAAFFPREIEPQKHPRATARCGRTAASPPAFFHRAPQTLNARDQNRKAFA